MQQTFIWVYTVPKSGTFNCQALEIRIYSFIQFRNGEIVLTAKFERYRYRIAVLLLCKCA